MASYQNMYCILEVVFETIELHSNSVSIFGFANLDHLPLVPLTFLCLSLVELMSSCRNCDWIWYSKFLSRELSASCRKREEQATKWGPKGEKLGKVQCEVY